MSYTLEKKDVLKKNFNSTNYNNDLAFGCFSLAHDFDFEGNENVLEITKLN